MSIIYHSAEPEARQTKYLEHNNLDFILNVGPGRSLMRNSVRLNANIKITDDGTQLPTGTVYLDYKLGAHAVIENIQVSFTGGVSPGLRENISNYARWVNMLTTATHSEDDYNNGLMACELRSPNENCSSIIAQGTVSTTTTPVTDLMDFSMKPQCILNTMQGDHLPYEKTGDIRLTFNLARNMSALMGAAQGPAATYEISSPHVSYQSSPTVGDPMKSVTSMRTVYNVKQAILSGTSNISVQVPGVSDACSISFQRQDLENVNVFNNYDLAMVQGIRDVQFLFNDSTNKYVTYQQSDLNTMIKNYVDSFNDTGHTQMYLDTFRNNKGFGLGQGFAGFVDLSRQRFALQMVSDITNIHPYNCYMYFHMVLDM